MGGCCGTMKISHKIEKDKQPKSKSNTLTKLNQTQQNGDHKTAELAQNGNQNLEITDNMIELKKDVGEEEKVVKDEKDLAEDAKKDEEVCESVEKKVASEVQAENEGSSTDKPDQQSDDKVHRSEEDAAKALNFDFRLVEKEVKCVVAEVKDKVAVASASVISAITGENVTHHDEQEKQGESVDKEEITAVQDQSEKAELPKIGDELDQPTGPTFVAAQSSTEAALSTEEQSKPTEGGAEILAEQSTTVDGNLDSSKVTDVSQSSVENSTTVDFSTEEKTIVENNFCPTASTGENLVQDCLTVPSAYPEIETVDSQDETTTSTQSVGQDETAALTEEKIKTLSEEIVKCAVESAIHDINEHPELIAEPSTIQVTGEISKEERAKWWSEQGQQVGADQAKVEEVKEDLQDDQLPQPPVLESSDSLSVSQTEDLPSPPPPSCFENNSSPPLPPPPEVLQVTDDSKATLPFEEFTGLPAPEPIVEQSGN